MEDTVPNSEDIMPNLESQPPNREQKLRAIITRLSNHYDSLQDQLEDLESELGILCITRSGDSERSRVSRNIQELVQQRSETQDSIKTLKVRLEERLAITQARAAFSLSEVSPVSRAPSPRPITPRNEVVVPPATSISILTAESSLIIDPDSTELEGGDAHQSNDQAPQLRLTNVHEDTNAHMEPYAVPFDYVAVGFVGPFSTSTAETIATLWLNIFKAFRFPKVILSDCDTNFMNQATKAMLYAFGMDQRLISLYRSPANVFAERAVRTATCVIKKLLNSFRYLLRWKNKYKDDSLESEENFDVHDAIHEYWSRRHLTNLIYPPGIWWGGM